MSNIGTRIKNFRKRAGLSQMQLELELGASTGSVSRIESGKVNPTKETVKEIAEILKLVHKEILYLEGIYDEDSLERDLELAVKEVEDPFSNPVFLAYLLDEKHRARLLSEGFKRLFNLTNKDLYSKYYGTNLLQLMLDPSYLIRDFVETDHYKTLLENELMRFRLEVPFWNVDSYCKDMIESLKKFPEFNRAWENVLKQPIDKAMYNTSSKRVYFKFSGKEVPMDYTRDYLSTNGRFVIVAYIPASVSESALESPC